MTNPFFRLLLPGLSACLLCACATLPGPRAIDRTVAAAMQAFSVPGVALGVVKDGAVVHARGYGLRQLGRPQPVDGATLFRIASNSKAMTTAALAMLVDQGRLAWDDKVVDYIPAFALHDAWISREFNVVDLLTHRSGLGLGAGDLMLWPKPNSFTRDDVIRGLRYFEPAGDFRAGYAYDNTLYIVAGELIPAVTGQRFETFLDRRLFGALGLRRCFAGDIPAKEMRNLAVPHSLVAGELRVVERNRIRAETSMSVAAGGVRCSLDDMLIWIQLQLGRGLSAGGERFWSEAEAAHMWSPQTIRPVTRYQRERERQRDGTHFKAYGLGWRLADVKGYKEVAHTGTFTGWGSNVVLIPQLGLGVVVLTNGGLAGPARAAIANSIVRPYLGQRGVDWIAAFTPEPAAEAAGRAATTVSDDARAALPLRAYVGYYEDPWFGGVDIDLKRDGLYFAARKSPRLQGPLHAYDEHRFVARWSDRTLHGDAFVDFLPGARGMRMRLEPLPETTDWSFNYRDLDFLRVVEEE